MIFLNLRFQPSQSKNAGWVDHHVLTHSPSHSKALGRSYPHADWRVGALERLRSNGYVLKAVKIPFKRKGLTGPGFDDDLQTLIKPSPALFKGRTETFVDVGKGATANAELDSAATDEVQGRNLFGNPNRVRQGQQYYSGSETHILGAGSNVT